MSGTVSDSLRVGQDGFLTTSSLLRRPQPPSLFRGVPEGLRRRCRRCCLGRSRRDPTCSTSVRRATGGKETVEPGSSVTLDEPRQKGMFFSVYVLRSFTGYVCHLDGLFCLLWIRVNLKFICRLLKIIFIQSLQRSLYEYNFDINKK